MKNRERIEIEGGDGVVADAVISPEKTGLASIAMPLLFEEFTNAGIIQQFGNGEAFSHPSASTDTAVQERPPLSGRNEIMADFIPD